MIPQIKGDHCSAYADGHYCIVECSYVKHDTGDFLSFLLDPGLPNDDQYVTKSCWMPEAMLNASDIHNHPATLVPLLTSLLIILNQKNRADNS